jgi:hypothetical protein
MKERHWSSLVTGLRHGHCVLVLGPEIAAASPGRSADDGKPDDSFAEALTCRLASELEEDGRRVTGATLAAVAQQYEDTQGFGPSALRALASEFYTSSVYAPSSVHHALARLPFGLILTTCHDDLFARALAAAGKKPLVQRYHLRGDKLDNPEFLLPGQPDTPSIYHLFGEAREPRSMVLSENDLLDFLIAIISERPPLPNSLGRVLKRDGQSFLFVGFGIKQWYLRVLLKVLVRALELHRTGSTIATEPLRGLSDPDREQTILFYQRGTRIEVEDADTDVFLAELARRLEAGGGYVAHPTPLGSCPRVFISYAREDKDLAARLFDALHRTHFQPWLDSEALRGGDDWHERVREELKATDFVLALYTPALCRKVDSYVNREIALARDRAMSVRGRFLIPLRTAEIPPDERIAELGDYQEEPLRPAHFDEDVARVISLLTRDHQRRSRWST